MNYDLLLQIKHPSQVRRGAWGGDKELISDCQVASRHLYNDR